jgi:hypothetical protein
MRDELFHWRRKRSDGLKYEGDEEQDRPDCVLCRLRHDGGCMNGVVVPVRAGEDHHCLLTQECRAYAEIDRRYETDGRGE